MPVTLNRNQNRPMMAAFTTGTMKSAPIRASAAAIGVFWFLLKVSVIIYLMIWFRGTFPRFRYDQLMNIGWKVMIPVGMAAIVINAVLGMTRGA